jgi:FtsP/CotA-like multicopper oxidase with cupredoxin domain
MMERRTFTARRFAIVLLAVCLALGIGLALAQTQKSVPQPVDKPEQAAQASAALPVAPQQAAAAEPDSEPAGESADTASEAEATAAVPVVAAAAAVAPDDPYAGRTVSRMRSITNAQRMAAAKRAAERLKQAQKPGQGMNPPLTKTPSCTAPFGTPCGPVDYFGVFPNFALSKLPTLTLTSGTSLPATYAVTAGTGIRKFLDGLPGLGPANANAMGNFIPVAVPFTTRPPGVPTDVALGGSDYYEIGLYDYTHQFSTDLLSTTNVRGYADLNPAAAVPNAFSKDNLPHYLGPVILAQTNRPVRIKFTNKITANTSFFLPVDTSIMGAGTGPDGTSYSNNRANIHLHGGNTPWISDGTPHQWTAPAGETTHFLRGVSATMVPDMWYNPTSPYASVAAGTSGATNDPGPGSLTYYYTNQQSGRFLFYHDHAYGITRLNVYAGEAAGYLIHDTAMDALIANHTIPNNAGLDLSGVTTPPLTGGVYTYGIPIIVQDKTFVPPATQLAAQDPTWNWGSEGNLWFPHVYMPNQAPDNPDFSGANPMGRWDLGSWFWPPMTVSSLAHQPIQCGTGNTVVTPGYPSTSMCPPTPNPSLVPESFLDTPVINGQAYPTVSLKQGAYRFQVLNAANDRMFNMSLFYAADANGNVCNPNYVGINKLGNTSVPPAPAACTEVKMVAANPHPLVLPLPARETPPDADDTVPACATSQGNPDVLRGSGFLVMANPSAVDYNSATGLPGKVTPCWPSSWPTDGRDGGVPDPTTAGPPWIQIGTEGGVLPQAVVIPPTPVGYNYNRRDIVVLNVQEHALFLGPAERADVIVDLSQVPVNSTLILYNDSPAPVPGFDTRLDTYTGDPDQTLTGGAPTTQPGYGPNIRTMMQIKVIAGGTTTPYNIATLQAAIPGVFAATQPAPIIPEKAYPAVAQGGTPAADTYARIQSTSLTYTPIGGTAVTEPLGAKAIHELFESDYGRMNSVLATEVPLTTFTNQTTIPLAYVDPPTEILNDGQVQMWKITHNGVDSHAIHFHLVNVQLINRVGWDGAVRPPDPNEIGWKETVRMNPLEDAIVAMKPVKMTFPFAIPESTRLLDPTRPQYATNAAGMPGFTNIDPYTNNAVTTVNDYTNFGWEYVWHCHLLGHEESDMMRPIVFKVAVPLAPFNLAASLSGAGGSQQANLSWRYTQGTTAATQFIIKRAAGVAGVYSAIGSPVAVTGAATAGTNSTYTNAFVDGPLTPGTTYSYQVYALTGTSLSAQSNTASVTPVLTLNPPTGLTAASKTTTTVTLTWTAPVPVAGGTVTGYIIQRAPSVAGSPGTWAQVGTSTTATFRSTGMISGTPYFFRVQATGTYPASAFTAPLAVTTN